MIKKQFKEEVGEYGPKIKEVVEKMGERVR